MQRHSGFVLNPDCSPAYGLLSFNIALGINRFYETIKSNLLFNSENYGKSSACRLLFQSDQLDLFALLKKRRWLAISKSAG